IFAQRIYYANEKSGTSGDEKIQSAINEAKGNTGHKLIIVEGIFDDKDIRWIINKTITIPSNTTIILKGVHLMVNDSVSQRIPIFTNDDYANGNQNIHIIGEGGAKIDGNVINHDEKRGGQLYFYNIDYLSFRGVQIGSTAGWAMYLEKVSNLHIDNLHFFQDNNHPWQDGIHVVGPASSIVINNITGTFGDDVVVADALMSREGEGGDVSGMMVSNVVATNVHGAGLLRVIPSDKFIVEGIHLTNSTLFTESGGTDAAIKIGWDAGTHVYPREQIPMGNMRNITIDNIFIPYWKGPVIDVQNPVKNLTISNVTSRHMGPFFYNLQHDIDGLHIIGCHSTLIGNPPETMAVGYLAALAEGRIPYLIHPYNRSYLDDPLGCISFDHAKIQDLSILNCTFEFDGESTDDTYPKTIRFYDTAEIDGVYINNIIIKDYATGFQIDDSSKVSNYTEDLVRFTNTRVHYLINGQKENESYNN
ncbi:MAG: hypothetical protein ACOCW8_00065, partial [bacterium]